MLETAVAQIQIATALACGRRFSVRALNRMISALQQTQHEFGAISTAAADFLSDPALDAQTLRMFQLRRFRAQAVRAARTTRYYQRLFDHLGLDPARLRSDDIARIPLTPKAALRDDPDAFVSCDAQPVLRTMTTGTTGWPTSVAFSAYELQLLLALAALGLLIRDQVTPADVVQINWCSRAMHILLSTGAAFARLGATVHQVGQVEPAHALKLLAERHALTGKKPQVSVLLAYASYLGELVEHGLQLGYRPADFGLEQIVVGGELVTDGLKARTRQLFGPVRFREGYAMTETLPFGATRCEQGHLHFEVSHGLLEVLSLESDAPAAPGALGTIVATPFYPYRETTLLLRYDTQDVVRPIAGPLTCSLQTLPATSEVLGKLPLAVRHAGGWTFPRDVLEALEACEAVPLPARYSCWALSEGVAVEVVVRMDTPTVRRTLTHNLEARGIPLQELRLVTQPHQLRLPCPVRADLKEHTFGLSQPGGPLLPATSMAQLAVD
jgi:phenylacetate-CoA ligase